MTNVAIPIDPQLSLELLGELPKAVLLLDTKGNVIYSNRACRELLELPPGQGSGQNVFNYLDGPQKRQEARAYLEYLLQKRPEPSPYFNQINIPGAKLFDLRFDWDYRLDADGMVSGFIVVLTDLNARQMAGRRILDNEKRFRLLYERSPLGYQSLDEQGNLLDVNQAWLDAFGYERGEVIGRAFSEFIHPGGQEHFKMNFPRFKAPGEMLGAEFEMRRKDGTYTTVELHGSIGYNEDGSFGQTHCILQDVTGRRHAEKALVQSEERFRQITDNISQVFWLSSPDWRIFYFVSRAYEDIWQRSRSQLYEKPGDWLRGVHPGDRDLILHHVRGLRGSGVRVGTLPLFRVVRPDGKDTRWVKVRYFPVAGSEGEVYRVAGIAEDVTERKRSEEMRMQLEIQLRQAQKMQAIGTLAGGVAHDFNNILGAVVGYTELAQEMIADGEDPSQELGEVLKAAGRGRDLVRRIGAFSRKAAPELRPLDLNQQVTGTVKMLERTIPKMIDIDLELGRDLTLINGDPVQLTQVLMNLGANAADAMPGGGRLTIKTFFRELSERFCALRAGLEPGPHLGLVVADTGQGMDKQTLEQLFDPFFTTKGPGKGTGLGLSVVFGVVKSHGGLIECESSPGGGAVFTIYLPCAKHEARQVVEELDEHPVAPLKSGQVLLVDDETPLLNVVSRQLAEIGFEVVTAKSGEQALEVLEQQHRATGLVILDMGMPGMGGQRCLERIKELYPDMKVVVASGYAMDGGLQEVIKQSAAAYLSKPFKKDELLQVVRKVLN